jgi:hypothetical protein
MNTFQRVHWQGVLFISGVTEEADADNYVTFEGETLLCFKKLVLEACAPHRVLTLNLPTMDWLLLVSDRKADADFVELHIAIDL